MKANNQVVSSGLQFIKSFGPFLAALSLCGPGFGPRATAQTASAKGEGALATSLPALSRDEWKSGTLLAKLGPELANSGTVLVTNRLVSFDDWWRYHDLGVDLGSAWRGPGFEDVGWAAGPGLLGYETALLPFPILTPLAQRNNVVTRYFRARFNFDDEPAAAELRVRTVIDDGAVFYLNGVEVLRLGMPAGVTVLYATQPSRAVDNATIEGPFVIAASNLVAGENVLAVELHQAGAASTDAVFGAELETAVTNGLSLAPADRLPKITSQPRNLTVQVGSPATFLVMAVDATNVPPVTRAAGSNTDRFVYPTGTPRGTLSVSYNFYNVPDRMQVFYEGRQVFDSGLVSGSSTILVPFGPGTATEVEIVMNETNGLFGTIWDYTASIIRPPLTYRWRLNGADIPGTTNDTLSIPAAQFSDAGRYSVVVANASGNTHSLDALLTVQTAGIPPRIISITPLNQTVPAGSNAAITVTATGNEPLAYRWFRNGVALAGRTNPTIEFNPVQSTNAGAYYCRVTNSFGNATSAVATLTVAPPSLPPLITSPNILPVITVSTGEFVDLSVVATGTPPLSYQWYFNGPTQPLSGQRNDFLLLTSVQAGQAGTYTVVVSNAFGTATSLGFVVNVLQTGQGSLIEFLYGSSSSNGLVFDLSGTNLVSPGSSILAELDAGLTPGPLFPLGGTAGFVAPGRFAGGPRRLRLSFPGQTVFARVRCWSAAHGASFEQALRAGGPIGRSSVFPVVLPDALNGTALLTNMPSFSLLPGLPPEITFQPQSLTITQGMDAQFNVEAYGSATIRYQWRLDGMDIPGAILNSLFLPAAQPAQSGRYSVRVSNAFGTVESVEAMLVVVPTNRPPVAFGETVSLAEDTPTAIRLMASDPNGDALSYTVNPPQFGSLNGTPPVLVYSPPPDYFGPDSFTFTVSDGVLASEVATIHLTIQAVNDPPIANAQRITVNEDSSVTITLVAVDVDGDALTYSVKPPAHGALSGAAPNLIYRPAANYHGPDRFTFSVNDSQASSPAAEVTITVASVNDPPVAVATVAPLVSLTPGNTNWIVLSPNGSNAPVILDATLSFDTENDPLQFAWLEGEPPMVLGGGPRLTNTFNAGEHAVVLLADDGMDMGAGELTFLVLSPGEAVGEVILMLDQSSMPRQAMRPLLATLKASIASLDRGNWTAGANQLHAFLNKIRAQVAPNDPQLAEDLTAAVEVILQTARQ